eukprot:gene9991-6973_t
MFAASGPGGAAPPQPTTSNNQQFATLILEEEIEMLDEDPTLGRNMPLDTSADNSNDTNACYLPWPALQCLHDLGAPTTQSPNNKEPRTEGPSARLVETIRLALEQSSTAGGTASSCASPSMLSSPASPASPGGAVTASHGAGGQPAPSAASVPLQGNNGNKGNSSRKRQAKN